MSEFLTKFQGYFATYFFLGIALIITTVIHECAHGYVAFLCGDDTAKRAGRLTLNPIKHIDLVGAITMVLFKFGWAKAVPIDVSKFRNKKLGLFLVSIAGVTANIIMAFLSMTILVKANIQNGILWDFLYLIMIYNVYFAVFNILPIPPLDGSKVLASFLPKAIMDKFLSLDRYFFIVLVVLLYFGGLRGPLSVAAQFVISNMYSIVQVI